MIQIQHVSKTYTQADVVTKALTDINIHINKGDIFGIIGMSGAGKSTLLRCLSALEKPTEGEIIIDGISTTNLKSAKLTQLRRDMGVVFQGYNLLMQKTVFENIAFPLQLTGTNKKQIETTVLKLLELVDLQDKKDAYPSQLSGGQKQRIAIARALATNPNVLLCDEPTSALDPLTTRQVLKLLKNISETLGVTVIIITHEINVVRSICNRVAVIDNGTVAESGQVKTVFENPQHSITKLLLDWKVN